MNAKTNTDDTDDTDDTENKKGIDITKNRPPAI